MKSHLTIALFTLFFFSLKAQNGGGAHHFHSQQCISDEQRNQMLKECQDAYQKLIATGKTNAGKQRKVEKLIWPLKNADHYPGIDLYAITGFVDHNPTFSAGNDASSIEDYQCGARTYDTGIYNHAGTDIALWPFHWNMMEQGYGEVIAAKSGTILLKKDGIFDQSCKFCTNCDWNAVYILHEDNTVAIYGHLKKGSVTNKKELDEVSQGDLLGLVGSSGNSTGPHLHFELTDINGFIIDPFSGSCNPTTTESLWETQKPYFEPGINRIMTASKAPIFGVCPNDGEESYESSSFKPGDTVIYAAYYHDQILNSVSNFKVSFPNGEVYTTFSLISPETYFASYWYWTFDLPSDAPSGTYTFSCNYEGKETKINFEVVSSTSVTDQNSPIHDVVYMDRSLVNKSTSKKYTASIYNSLGQAMMHGIIDQKLDLSQLPIGSYFVKLRSNQENILTTLKIVIL
jgi:murein DD-endopeptidase MepM/ murein hydrolase activator NlpD